MPLRDYVTGRQNKIVIAGVGIGLIFSAVTTYSLYVRPAVQIEQPDGDVLFTLSDHGAIGVQSGSGVSFGSLSDCLKSGGSSGATMTFGTCGSGGGGSVNTGAILNAANDRFVNVSGDTMTGALAIRVTGGNANTLGLRIENTGSGRHLHAEQLLTTSGSLITEGTSYFTGNMSANALFSFVGYSASPQLTATDTTTGLHFDGPSILSFHNGGTQTMLLSSSNNVGIGTGSPRTKLEVVGTMSGRSLRVTGTGASALLTTDITTGRVGILTTAPKATLDVIGSISGSSLFIANLNAASCDVKSTNGVLSCGTDATGGGGSSSFGSGNVITIGNQRYVSKQGDTMTGALAIQNGNTHSATTTPLLNIRGTMSGRSLYITGTGGSALVMTNITTGRVGIGTSAPKVKLDVVGTISGSALTVSSITSGRVTFAGAGGSITSDSALSWDNTNKTLGVGTTASTNSYEKMLISGSDATGNGIASILQNTATTGAGNPVFAIYSMRTGTSPTADGVFFGGKATAYSAYGIVNGITMRPGQSTQDLGLAAGSANLGTAVGPALIIKSNTKIGIGDTTGWVTGDPSYGQVEIISKATATPSLVLKGASNHATSLLEFRRYDGTYIGGMSQSGWLSLGRSAGLAKTSIDVIGTISGSLITQNGAGNNYFMGNFGLGKIAPSTKLDVIGTMSGSRLVVSGNSMMSGALVVKGNITTKGNLSGASLNVTSLKNCNLDTDANGLVTCGTDASGGGGSGVNLKVSTFASTDLTVTDSSTWVPINAHSGSVTVNAGDVIDINFTIAEFERLSGVQSPLINFKVGNGFVTNNAKGVAAFRQSGTSDFWINGGTKRFSLVSQTGGTMTVQAMFDADGGGNWSAEAPSFLQVFVIKR